MPRRVVKSTRRETQPSRKTVESFKPFRREVVANEMTPPRAFGLEEFVDADSDLACRHKRVALSSIRSNIPPIFAGKSGE